MSKRSLQSQIQVNNEQYKQSLFKKYDQQRKFKNNSDQKTNEQKMIEDNRQEQDSNQMNQYQKYRIPKVDDDLNCTGDSDQQQSQVIQQNQSAKSNKQEETQIQQINDVNCDPSVQFNTTKIQTPISNNGIYTFQDTIYMRQQQILPRYEGLISGIQKFQDTIQMSQQQILPRYERSNRGIYTFQDTIQISQQQILPIYEMLISQVEQT